MVEANRAKVPYHVVCAYLEHETGGQPYGGNVFGHDPTIFIGAGEVTRKKYLAYKKLRGTPGRQMQGVGPLQLTWWTFQDKADSYGGCWKPKCSIRVGVELLASYYAQSHDWREVALRYNGAQIYAEKDAELRAKWLRILTT